MSNITNAYFQLTYDFPKIIIEENKLVNDRDFINKALRQKKRLLILSFHLMSNYKVVNIIVLHQLGT